ncbi:MAG: hypothetical protein EXX96DRAFT_571564 [Benjaminiella poitrasii]|nr:MAG: hypothetical protein EXX96DRAFT_571564 [Benjaminiella poitrasii]
MDHLDRLLLVFVHGFRGTDTSFKDFPNKLRINLTNTVKAEVHVLIYPSYKTAGDLRVAVENFSSWLCDQASQIKQEMDQLQSSGKIMIILLGHSMGGIVSAETILRFHNSKKHQLLLNGEIIGLLAFDTPFYSINENFIADKAASGLEQVRGFGNLWNAGAATVTAATATRAMTASTRNSASTAGNNSSTKKWGLFAGVVGAAALGTAAYIARDKIQATLTDVYDHLTFIKDLTDINGCDERVRKLVQVPDILFRCFYIHLDELDKKNKPKTFIKLPPEDLSYLFIPVLSSADNEVHAHTSMFNPEKTAYYNDLCNDSVSLSSEMVARFQRKPK